MKGSIMAFREISDTYFGQTFGLARDFHEQIREATSEFSHETGTRYFLDTDGKDGQPGWAGFGIRSDGELVYVWAIGGGRGDDIVTHAVENGATYLDCFDGYLPTFYARHGFEAVATVPNWTPGGPSVVLMALPGYADRHGVEVSA